MATKDELQELYRKLSAPFPPEAIERTTSEQTGRGYNTTGIKAAYVLDRLNQVLGVGGFRYAPVVTVRERQARNGRLMFEGVCELTLQLGAWQSGSFVPFAEAPGVGGHVAALEADARKGAVSNALKKAAAGLGCGWQAFAGRLDDDNAFPDPLDRGGTPERERPRPPAGRGPDTAPAPQARTSDGRRTFPQAGRVTSSQLAKLRELVEEGGGNWGAFRASFFERRGLAVESASSKVASDLITELATHARAQRTNGTVPGGRAR